MLATDGAEPIIDLYKDICPGDEAPKIPFLRDNATLVFLRGFANGGESNNL